MSGLTCTIGTVGASQCSHVIQQLELVNYKSSQACIWIAGRFVRHSFGNLELAGNPGFENVARSRTGPNF